MPRTVRGCYNRGLPAPSFVGEPVISSKTATEKTSEPAANDPPILRLTPSLSF
ncbi:hypothetical protein DY000_02007629 [Brassica cretica]|uniref:Uncharacterized protein n=1 Tax=Brassica cretica TaxID=69181 RepID=A0ABQ7CAR9_BRACR|nr:hypothetical protein DY000_02007629 [Brassica cretica]